MKAFLAIARLIVGSLFIVSGLIKCNDAIGFSYKLNDYFAPDVLGMEFLIPYSLLLAVIICVVEIVLGVAVIFGFKSRLVTTLILLMMLFFTWLTWYTSSCLEAQEAASLLGAEFSKNCVTDCGCFGDALKLEPKESFYKDLFLLIFTIPLFIFAFRGKIPKNKPKQDLFYIAASLVLILGFGVFVIGWWFTVLFSVIVFALVYLVKNKTKNAWFSLLFVYVISLGYTWYCLQNLPLKDFRAYKVDSNILENMSTPENAPKAVVDYHWKFNVDGQEQIITTRGSYPTVEGGDFVSVETEEIEAGYEVPILDFSIEKGGEDYTESILNEDNVLMIVMYNLSKSEAEGLVELKSITDEALRKGYKVIGITASQIEKQQEIAQAYKLNFDFYFCDEKALKTVIRSNPGIMKLQKGTIIQKLHWNNIQDLKLETLPNATPNLNVDLKRQLDSVMVLDQKYRANHDHVDWNLQQAIDSSNTAFIEDVFKEYGYPGKSIVGEKSSSVAFFVIQHSNKIPDYLELIKKAGAEDEVSMKLVAMLEDRYLMQSGEEQVYGTQGMTYGADTDNPFSFMWPIKDVENVNKRRKKIGYETTVEEYSKRVFGNDFEFKNYTIQEINKRGRIVKN